MSKRSIILRSTYATCLALATVAHVLVDLRFGVLLDGLAPLGYPVGVRLYWASLAFLDPAAAILLFVRPRAGLVLCAAIIATDVLNNSWVAYHRSEFSPPVLDSAQMVHHGFGDDISLILQVAFLLFVFATLRIAWRGLPQNQPP
jgi:hypothetical protein